MSLPLKHVVPFGLVCSLLPPRSFPFFQLHSRTRTQADTTATMSLKTLALGLGLLSVAQYVQGQTCYWPNHDEAANFTSCNVAATESSCCRPSEACLSNGLCLQTEGLPNRISRGACTDSTFSSSACPSACNDVYTGSSLTIFEAYDNFSSTGDVRVEDRSPIPPMLTTSCGSFAAAFRTINRPHSAKFPRRAPPPPSSWTRSK